jgi:hypothetical protein
LRTTILHISISPVAKDTGIARITGMSHCDRLAGHFETCIIFMNNFFLDLSPVPSLPLKNLNSQSLQFLPCKMELVTLRILIRLVKND